MLFFLTYLTTLSVGQATQRPVVGWLESNELERVWEEASFA
jgi:hypothetical protein